jgi:hypothetical protein
MCWRNPPSASKARHQPGVLPQSCSPLTSIPLMPGRSRGHENYVTYENACTCPSSVGAWVHWRREIYVSWVQECYLLRLLLIERSLILIGGRAHPQQSDAGRLDGMRSQMGSVFQVRIPQGDSETWHCEGTILIHLSICMTRRVMDGIGQSRSVGPNSKSHFLVSARGRVLSAIGQRLRVIK